MVQSNTAVVIRVHLNTGSYTRQTVFMSVRPRVTYALLRCEQSPKKPATPGLVKTLTVPRNEQIILTDTWQLVSGTV